ncbi:Bax inhibitor-1/YccA family protein [Fructobacillus tropaeoli]|uniref:Bax inhibitor (BI-1)/TMBIM family (YbhL) n=1 Tax=Fructobacillus tropaeoli TaxID=709323 RepID=A0ABM9MS61_9LACO|nr:Bax inhibitor (BI-1)/TMBIM family (YbhL) [Fructobacillus tropaeoli]
MDNFDMNARRDVTGADEGMKSFFQRVYGYMAIALAVTAVAGYVVQHFFLQQVAQLFLGSWIGMAAVVVVELVIVAMIRSASFANNPSKAFGLLMAFSAVQGLTLGLILAVYTAASVGAAFISTAALFAGMAAYSYFSKKSMASMGPILFGSLIGIIVASVINIFMGSSTMHLLISVATVIVFALYTAYDNNTLRQVYVQLSANGASEAQTTGLAVSGALMLYLDFMNIFYALIQLFGDNRN